MPIVVCGLITLVGAFALSLILTRIMVWLAPRVGLVDSPGRRRIHTEPTPRAGGIAVWATFVIVATMLFMVFPVSGKLGEGWYGAFVITSGLLILIGLVDDRWGLSAWIKLSGQIAVAVILFFCKGSGVGNFLGFEVHWSLDLLIWVVWTVGIINAFNLIDGLDGLCGGMALISVGALAVVSLLNGRAIDTLMMLVMVGAIGGFLRYNIHPARIFLGDTGSMFLGFFLASAASISAGERAVAASLLVPLLVAGVPFIDVVLAVWRRTARKWLGQMQFDRSVRIFGADMDHLHHRLLKLGLAQRKVAMLFYGAAILVSAIALLPILVGTKATGIAVAAFVIAGIVGLRYIAPIELSTSGTALHFALRKPAASRYLALVYFGYDALVIVLALGVAFMIENSGDFEWVSHGNVVVVVAVTLACGLGGLRMARAHSRHWARASLRDFWAVILWFAVAMNVAFSLMTFMAQDLAWASMRLYLLTTVFCIPALLLPRSLTPLIREALVDSRHRRKVAAGGSKKRILLYGAGDLGELFLSHLKTAPPAEMEEMCIVGFIDDRINLQHKLLDGFRIRGSIEHLADLADRFDLHGVVLTVTRLDSEYAERLNRVCEEKGLTLYRWRPQLQIREIGSQELDGEDRLVVGRNVFQAASYSVSDVASGL